MKELDINQLKLFVVNRRKNQPTIYPSVVGWHGVYGLYFSQFIVFLGLFFLNQLRMF